MALTFEPLTADHVQFAAEAASRLHPHHPIDVEELRLRWNHAAGVGGVRRWLVSAEKPIGWCSVVVPEGTAGHGEVNLVLPGLDAAGCEEACAHLEREARSMGVTDLASTVWEDLDAVLEGLRRRGFALRRRERFWRLELGPARERLRAELAAARARAEAAGVRIVQAGELGGERPYPDLREIHNRAQHDIPSSVPAVDEPWEVWVAWMQPPQVLPGRVWVAVVDGRPVGYSYLAWRSTGLVDTGFTAVLREHRGKGIARALKLASLVQAEDLGVEMVETDNDSENGPIIHLNQDLGYEEIPGQVEMHKRLA